ncbi:MAG: hypothetical protein FJ276_30685 [Planctomycetes bacterium]|nr:hypothetical protein [Planctomycetota bacterium]
MPKDVHFAGRKAWIVGEEYIQKTERYIRNLLGHENRHSHRLYKDDPTVAVFEIMNEPGYLS